MTLQMVVLAKVLMTYLTLVWSFSRMSQHVFFQLAGEVKPFVANLASIRLVTGVDLLVNLQIFGCGECLGTSCTGFHRDCFTSVVG